MKVYPKYAWWWHSPVPHKNVDKVEQDNESWLLLYTIDWYKRPENEVFHTKADYKRAIRSEYKRILNNID